MDPATRVLMDKYFELERAKEEITRLNMEWKRVQTWVRDERRLFVKTIKELWASEEEVLAPLVEQRWQQVKRAHQVIMHWLRRTQELPLFSGVDGVARAVRPEGGSKELHGRVSERGDTGKDVQADDRMDGEEDAGSGEENEADTVGMEGCLQEVNEFDNLVHTLGSISV